MRSPATQLEIRRACELFNVWVPGVIDKHYYIHRNPERVLATFGDCICTVPTDAPIEHWIERLYQLT